MGMAAGLAGIFAFLGRQPDLKNHVPEFISLMLLAGGIYVVGVFLVNRYSLGRAALGVILGGTLLFRLVVLGVQPSLSDDLYRYQWEGQVQRARINPYTVFPALPQLARFENRDHPVETGKNTSTPYPPASELAFVLAETVSGTKRLFVLLDLVSVCLLLWLLSLKRQPLDRILTYGWNPTVVVSFAMCGHHDSLANATLLAANLLIISQRQALSIVALAVSFLSKYFSGFLLPVFLKRTRWTYAGIFAATVGVGYLPYITAGRGLFKGLQDYAAGWQGNASLFSLLRLAGNSRPQAELVAGVLLAGLVLLAVREGMEPLRASLVILAGLLLLSPNAFPWYFTWTVPFLCFYPSPPWLLMTVTCVLGYSPVIAYAAGQPYRDSPFMLAVEYAPVCAWLVWEGAKRHRKSKFETPDPPALPDVV